ncbi:MAG: glycosyltransferase family 39 protein, partial [Myxococcota bacterium]
MNGVGDADALTARPRLMRAALVVVGAYVAILWASASSVGFVRDEGYYFKAAELYAGWFGTLFSSRFFDAFSDTEILKHFSYNNEHPPVAKLAQGATFHLFHRLFGWVSPSMGFRIAGILFAGLSAFATFLLGRRLVSAPVGLLAALMLTAMPRYFFDAHLACFDVPITALWVL